MSLTNLPPGHPRPDDSGGGAAADGHGGMGAPAADVVKRGYEADGYDTTSVISVPVLVVVFFVLAFATTTVLFAYFTGSRDYSDAHPMAAERNKAPLADRIARINRTGAEVEQPRLEPLRIRSGDSRSFTRPEQKSGNPPYLHPEDSRAEPARTPELFGKAKGIPLDQVIGRADANVFKVQEGADKRDWSVSSTTPSGANAGRGAEHSQAVPPVPPGPSVKKVEPKKEEPKKEQPPKGPNPGEVKK